VRLLPWWLFVVLGLPVQTAGQKPPTTSPAAATPPGRAAPVSPAALVGVVRAADGTPVANALIFGRRWNAPWGEPAISTRSDAAGAFRLPRKTEDALTLWVQAESFVLRRIDRSVPGRVLNVTLAPGSILEGRVLDGGTGSPIPEARVVAGLTAGDLPFVPLEADAGRVRATTDARGRFRLTGLGPGLQSLTASARGYGRVEQPNVRFGTQPELFLFPGASISGAVAGPDGKPAAGALVSVSRSGLWNLPSPERTDARGRFEIPGLDPGVYDVTAMKAGFAPGLVRGVSVRGTDDERVILNLDPPTAVVGRVISEPRHPVAARVLVQELGGAPTPRALASLLGADTEPDGRFRSEDVPPGSHALGVMPRGFTPRRVDLDVPSHRSQLDLGDILVERGLAIGGRVLTPSGDGIADAQLYARGRLGWKRSRAVAESDGSYVLAGLEPGPYEVSVQARGFAPGHGTFDAGARQADITLDVAGSIQGEVVDGAARAVESFSVTARRADGSAGSGQDDPVSQEFSVADGAFTLEDVPPGSWVLEIQAARHASATVPRVSVRSGAATAAGRIRLGDGGTLRGSVVNALGEPVAGASVSVSQQQDYAYQTQPPQTQSDGNGAYELQGIPPGKVDVAASHPSYARAYAPGIDIEPDAGPTDLKLVLSQGGRIEGTVRRRDGTPVVEASIRAAPGTSTGRSAPGDNGATASVGPEGTFTLEHVAAGLAQVSVYLPRGGSMRSIQRRRVDVRDGETATVDFVLGEILVSGTVSRTAGPAAGLRVAMLTGVGYSAYFSSGPDFVAAPREGPEQGVAVAGDDGHYEMLLAEPGTARVSVDSADGRTRLLFKRIEIPDVASFTADFALQGVWVAGNTLDADTEAPVPQVAVWAQAEGESGVPNGRASSDAGGRFQLELEPGNYRLTTEAKGYAPGENSVSVGPGGLNEVRLALSRGRPIVGRVLDGQARPVGGIEIVATAEQGDDEMYGISLPDGTFRLGRLAPRRYTVSAASGLLGSAAVAGVTPGDTAITLSLRPEGRAQLSVRDTEGAPVVGALALLKNSNGLPLNRYLGSSDAQGVVEVSIPYGSAVLNVATRALTGSLSLEIKKGETASASVALAPLEEE
jgi:Carboxypeptidase regulatory-like domain